MLQSWKRRTAACLGAATFALAISLAGSTGASAQSGEPIRIGYSMALTGGLGPNGQSALLAQKIWEEETNAKGGLLGRPVKLIYYDDQTNPSTVPGIYTKLLDVDKVDLIIGGYGTNMLAPAMPVVMQRKKVFIGLLGLGVNSEFNYPNYFVMIPSGPDPKPAFTKGFFNVAMAQNPKPTTVAIVAADAEFSVNASDGARENAKKAGWNGLLIGDMAQPRGGPMLSGHASHQIGLDADIWFSPMPDHVLSREEREMNGAVNMVAPSGLDVDHSVWTPVHTALVKAAAEDPEIARIFVNAAIKKAMCSEAGSDRAWLAKVRPWWGHAEHFHVRLDCPPDSPQCESQPPVPDGDGCGHALDYWFTAGVLHPKPPEKPPGPRTGPTLAALPAACKQVVKAP